VHRETLAAAIKRLVELRLVRVIKHTVFAIWANGGRQRRQAVSEYVLTPPADCEFGAPTVLRGQEIQVQEKPGLEVRKAQRALAEVRRRMEARMLRSHVKENT
jgi:hypothetical protein